MKDIKADIFFKAWFANGGLISQADTARIFECSSAYIDQLCREKKLNKMQVNKKKYLSCQEVYRYWTIKKDNLASG